MAADVSTTEEQAEILRSIDRFMERNFPPEDVRKYDLEHRFPEHLLKGYGDLGILAVPFPEQYGGIDGDWMTVTLIQERLGRHAAIAAALYSIVVDFGGMTLLKSGSEAQKQEFLPRLISGELQFALALSEPQAGTDAAALSTRAERSASGWRITGRKTWISLADTADYLVVPCRSDRDSKGKEGVTMFLVPRSAAGIHMTRIPKIGTNSMISFDIAFDDVEVAEDAVIGTVGDGFRTLMATLQYSRSGQAANAVGQAQAAIDLAVAHVKERQQFGRPLSQFQVLRHRLVDMQMRVDQARFSLYDLAARLSRGERCRRESAITKILASEALQYVTHHGMQMMASVAYVAESDMNRYWRDARLLTFGEGANEMLRDLVAREMGL